MIFASVFVFEFGVNKFAQAKRELNRLVVSISSAIPFLRNHLFQKENQKPVLFSAMVFRVVFRSSTVLLNASHFF